MVVRSLLLRPPFHGLLTPQRQQLGVGGKDLGHRVLELASLLDQRTDLLHPFIGNSLDALPTVHAEGQGPNGMSFSIDAPTIGFSAAAVSERERTRQSVRGYPQTTKQGVLALAQASGGITLGVVPAHLSVLSHTDKYLSSLFFRWGN